MGGGKIVSLHYADDAIITIKQNKCFKEVIKELTEFEQAKGQRDFVEVLGKTALTTPPPLNIK